MVNEFTPRERLITALNHKEPDRVPMELGSYHNSSIHLDSYLRLRDYLGIEGRPESELELLDPMQLAVRPEEAVLRELGIDTRGITYASGRFTVREFNRHLKEDEEYYYFKNEWGVELAKPKKTGFYFDVVEFPLENASVEEIINYDEYPDPDDPVRYRGVKQEISKLYDKTDYGIIIDIQGACVEELIWFQLGLERYLKELFKGSQAVNELLRNSVETQKIYISNLLEITGDKAQIIGVNGDLGGQDYPLMSPRTYRQSLKPYEEELIQLIKSKTSGTLIRHSCGNIVEFIPDFLEIGIQGINPVQVSAAKMNTGELKEKFGDELIFWGGIDTQDVLPHGSANEVRKEVKRRIRDLAPGGGYLLGAVHNIQRDVPPENICSMFDAAREFGQYPIA